MTALHISSSRLNVPLDAHRVRVDFPAFEQLMHGKALAYLDSAATAQKPRHVLETMREFLRVLLRQCAPGVYELSERATTAFEGAREKVGVFVNASSARKIISRGRRRRR